MRTLRHIQTATLRLAPAQSLCVILGAYLSLLIVARQGMGG